MEKMPDATRRDASMRPVGDVIRAESPRCAPSTTIRDAAQIMSAARRRYIVVPLPSGELGIFTDGDVRRRVVARGIDTDSAIGPFVTFPARTVEATRRGADVLMDMLALGLHQMPVVTADGALVGVVEDTDLYATATRAGFLLRSSIARAADAAELAQVCNEIPTLVVALCDARISPIDVSAIYSVLVETAVTRAVEFASTNAELSGSTWITLGSVARREALLSSDVESALIIGSGSDCDAATHFGGNVHDILDGCGLRRDPNNAVASQKRFCRTLAIWDESVDGWIEDPFSDQGIVMLSLLVDAVVTFDVAGRIKRNPRASALMLRECTHEIARLPLRDKLFRRTEVADVKRAVLAPITGIARWASIAAGSAECTTLGRLSDASQAGVLSSDDAAVLAESFEVVQQIRLRHQCDQVRRGHTADDRIPLQELTPLATSLLSNAVREVAGVQRTLAYEP